jgi:hypothetical protein
LDLIERAVLLVDLVQIAIHAINISGKRLLPASQRQV